MKVDDAINIPLPHDASSAQNLFPFVVSQGRLVNANFMPVSHMLNKLYLQKGFIKEKMAEIIKSNPTVMASAIDRAKKSDFRDFMKDLLEQEHANGNIQQTLHELRDESPKDYQQAILGWAKFAHGTEVKQELDINVQQRHEVYKSVAEEYALSENIEDAEVIEPDQLQAEYDSQLSPEEMQELEREPEPIYATTQNQF